MAYVPPLNGGRVNIAIGGNTAGAAALASTGTVTLAGGNNIVLSQAGNAITISGSNQSLQTQNNIQALVGGTATSTASTGTVTFANSNGVTFGMSGNTMTASVAAGGNNFGAGMIAAGNSAGNAGFAASQLAFVGGNNITLSQSTAAGGSNTITVSGPTFSNANGITFGTNGGTITASHNGITSQSVQTQSIIQGMYDGTNSISSGTVFLSDANNVNLGIAGNTITASAVVPQAIIAGTGTASTGTVSFGNANGVTFGMNGNTVTASVSAALMGGGGGVAISGGGTNYTSGTVNLSAVSPLSISSGTGQALSFMAPPVSSLVGAGGISLSTAGSTITISNAGGAAQAARWEYPSQVFTSIGAVSQSYMSIQHVYMPLGVAAASAKIAASISLNTFTSATTASMNNSLWMGIYTLAGSTLNLLASASANNGFTWGNTANASIYTASVSGLRQMTVPLAATLTAGDYWVAALLNTAAVYTNASYSIMGNNQIATYGQIGVLNSNSSAGRDVFLGQGLYTTTLTSMPNAITLASINNAAASNAMRAAFYHVLFSATY